LIVEYAAMRGMFAGCGMCLVKLDFWRKQMKAGRFFSMGAICLATGLAVGIAGCTSIDFPKASTQGATKSKMGQGKDPTTTRKITMIEEFGDVPVPSELKRNEDQSFIYEAPGVVIGVVIYEGRYKGRSIAQFFRNEMPNNGWRFLNAFSDTRYVLSFLKENRSCQISVEESTFGTRVVIKVGPTSS